MGIRCSCLRCGMLISFISGIYVIRIKIISFSMTTPLIKVTILINSIMNWHCDFLKPLKIFFALYMHISLIKIQLVNIKHSRIFRSFVYRIYKLLLIIKFTTKEFHKLRSLCHPITINFSRSIGY